MSRFLKFYNRIVNTAFIKRVDIEPDKYTIFLASNHHSGVSVLGIGYMGAHDDIIWASKTEHLQSYKVIDDWINNMPG